MDMRHLRVKQGDDFSATLTVMEDGVAANITGATLTWHLRTFGATTDTLAVPLTLLVPASGTATLTLTDVQTAALSPLAAYRYEIEMEDALGNISTPSFGRVFVTADAG
jgi:chitodextrinase